MDTPTDLADRIQRAEEIPGPRIPVVMPTDAEMLLVLAEAERPCPDCRLVEGRFVEKVSKEPYALQLVTCRTCEGIGRIPLYLTLRERCRVQLGWMCEGCPNWPTERPAVCPFCGSEKFEPILCERCKGRGWVPIQHDVTDEVWQALRSSGHPVEVLANGLLPIAVLIGNVHKKYIPGVQIEHIGGVRYEGENLRSTLLAAAVLATAEEEKP